MLLTMRNHFRRRRRTLPLGERSSPRIWGLRPLTPQQNVGRQQPVRVREVVMDIYSTCYNCGQQGHYASSCPLDQPPPASGKHPPRWKQAPRLPAEQQATINEWGIGLCRASLARRGVT